MVSSRLVGRLRRRPSRPASGDAGIGRGGRDGRPRAFRRRGRRDGFRQVRRELAAALENKVSRLFLQVELVERGVPVGLSPAPPFDSFVPRSLEERQRLPAGFFLGLLGPALVFLELVVDLLLGLGILVLASLGVALKRLDAPRRAPGRTGPPATRCRPCTWRRAARGGLVLGLFPLDPLAKAQLGLGLSSWRDRRSAIPGRSARRFLFERVATQA